jgi:hypothetical protein
VTSGVSKQITASEQICGHAHLRSKDQLTEYCLLENDHTGRHQYIITTHG